MKAAATTILLLFVAASLVYLVIGGGAKAPSSAPPSEAGPSDVTGAPVSDGATAADAQPAGAAEQKLVAYYFHGDVRCKTCLAMEQYAREAIEQNFAEQMKEGAIEWRAVNFNLPENEHYVRTYDLSASAVVLATTANGKAVHWRNLGLIWELVHDEFAYKAYIVNEVEEMMEEGS